MNNSQQIEYWNGKAGERWARQQARIDFNLSEITARLLPFLAAEAGQNVLDIGCGCGTTTLKLAEAVGQGGSVRGVDISAPMLGVARARAAEAGMAIDFVEADASACAFVADRDLIVSRFGVMFFAEPVAAFANIRKAARPGAALRFVCWATLAENPWARVPMEAARGLLPPQEPADPHAPGPFALGDATRLRGILESAGWTGIAITRLDSVMRMGADAEEAAEEALALGPLARAAAELSEDLRAEIKACVRDAMAGFATQDLGIAPPAACWLVEARG